MTEPHPPHPDDDYAPPALNRRPRSTPREERFPPVEPRRKTAPRVVYDDVNPLPPPKKPAPTPPPKKPKRKANPVLVNLLTGLLVASMLGVVGFGVFAWRYPYSPYNPFGLPTPLPVILTATFLPPTATPNVVVNAPQVSPTPTINAANVTPTLPSLTLALPTEPGSAPPLALPVETTATPLPTLSSDLPFIQDGDLLYTPNGNGSGCNWSSIAGVVRDSGRLPVNGLGVRVTDVTTGDFIGTVTTGSTATYGDGGYELPLGNVAQSGGYQVQVVTAGVNAVPLSAPVLVVTSDDCEQNVAVVNFLQVRPY
jgi:hypothetical protein